MNEQADRNAQSQTEDGIPAGAIAHACCCGTGERE